MRYEDAGYQPAVRVYFLSLAAAFLHPSTSFCQIRIIMRTFLLTLGAWPLLVCAQSWCPPGATWTYEAGQFLAGYHRMTYRADTVIDGITAQVLDRYSAVQYPQPTEPMFGGPPNITYTPVAVITRLENDVVYTFGTLGWDTLYWFSAMPGEGWTMAHVIDPECTRNIVTDIGSELVDGLPLRWLELEGGYRVYERIGSTFDLFLYCPNLIVDGPIGIRCYSDQEISFPSTSVNCVALVGMIDRHRGMALAPYPNPGTDRFTLTLPPTAHTITLVDATGRVVSVQHTMEAQPTIRTNDLPAGAYQITVTDGHGGTTHARWVKH